MRLTPGSLRVGAFALAWTCALAARAADGSADACIAPITYLPLDAAAVGQDDRGVAALGTYERISPDGRFILRSYSGARVGRVSLMELPAVRGAAIRVYQTPFSNEAFPVQGSWRYLVDVNGDHYRFTDVLRRQTEATALFRGGMTGFYAAASELAPGDTQASPEAKAQTVFIRSLSWPQDANPDRQGEGPLQLATIEIRDDGRAARLVRSDGPHFVCAGRGAVDGNVYALPMLSVDGTEFSAIPQTPRAGRPSMRVYGLDGRPGAQQHPCDMRVDLGLSPGKAVFGYAHAGAAAWLTYSDLGHVYVYDRGLGQTFRLLHAKDHVLASAFPGLTRDGRLIYGATWRDCADARTCPERAGYVVADPFQSDEYRAYWQRRGQPAPKACITTGAVRAERERFARMHDLAP